MAQQLTVVVVTTPEEHEVASDRLWSLGVAAISEFWADSGVVTLRTSLGDDEAIVDATMRATGLEYRLELVDSSVGDSWRAFAQPIRVDDRLIVAPSWCEAEAVAELRAECSNPDAVLVARIEPGATFGLGDHPTTANCLRLLGEYLEPGDEVLDVGCGSGVLGVVALMLGASRAHGVDINPASVSVSVANADTNGVADRWTVSTEPLEVIGRPFDLVVANILAPTLVELSDQLKRLTADEGVLIVSGVLDGRFDHVSEALEPLREIEKVALDGWAAIAFRR